MDIDLSEYLDMFVEETRDHLQKFSQDLIELENIKGENSKSDRAELLDSLFRVAHTIKGMSGSMDFKNMEKLCHIMENLLDELKNNIRQVTPDIIDILLNCFTKLEELTDCIENQKSDDIDISEILGILNNLKYNEKQNVSKIENLVQPITNTPEFNNEKNYSLKITIDKACNLKGVRGYLIIEEISKISEIIDTIPSRVDIEEGKFEHSFIVIIPQNPEKRETLIKSISSLVEVHAVENQIFSPTIVRSEQAVENQIFSPTIVRSEQSIKIEDMNQQKKEDSIIEKDIDSPKSDVLKSNTNGTPSTSNKVTGKSVRINIEKLDKVINLVGELVINRSRLIQISREHGLDDLSNTISIVEKTISDLQYEITQMRMLPVEHIFNRFPKLVRDLYRTQGKEIELKIYGKEIELDRIVLEEIVDPLVHLIRNSVDHGIEMPDEREKIGKNRKGTIILSATRETGFVVISIEDDGKGINPIDIKNSAIEKAKISKENASKLSENQILQLIFLPGFSTKQVATKISGRGVGMDVVKTKIEGMGGQVSIDSTIGKGSKMHLKIPLTTAIIQALLVKVGDKIYAIPLSQVLEIISISKNDIKTIQTKNVITLRDSIIPIIMLRNLFNQNSPTLKNDNESQVVIIIGRSDGQIGLVVDEAMEQQEIVVKPPDELLCNTKALSGFTILGNGKVVSILDVSSI